MKKHIIPVISIIAVLMLITFSACTKTIKFDETYYEYAYVNTDGVFVPSGRSIILNKDGYFTLTYSEDLELSGEYEHIENEKTIYLDCDDNTTTVVKEIFKQKLLNDPENVLTIEIIDLMLEDIVVTDELHYYKQYIFSSKFITAHRYIDTALYSFGQDYSAFEGVYYVSDYDGLMLLRNGEIYVQDTEDPKDGEFPKYKGTYLVSKDFLTMTINDEDGKPQDPQKYLIAELTLPYDMKVDDNSISVDEEIDDEEWYSDMEDQLEELAGKPVKVLVLCFFTRDNMN
jgi:hypothetical protein